MTSLSHADAARIVDAIRAALERDGQGAAVAVADPHGELIAFLRTDGCKLPSIMNAMNKAFTAAREIRATADIGEESRTTGRPMTNFGDLRYNAWGGGLPILVGGQLVGAVGVSGLSEDEDVALARIGVDLFAG
jgi:glc operon protein GlcG